MIKNSKLLCKGVMTLAFVIIILFLSSGSVRAEDNSMGFTVHPIQPSTQLDYSKTYFYIKTEPGVEQMLEVRIKSTQKEAVTVKMSGKNANTGTEGDIQYTDDLDKNDESLKVPMTSLVSFEPSEITVGNYEEKTVMIKVIPSKTEYEGVIMGALVFSLDTGKKEEEGLSDTFGYVLSIITSNTGEEFSDSKSLNLLSVKAAMNRGRKMVIAKLQNPEPKVLEHLKMAITLTDNQTKKVIKKKNVEEYKMAPNSSLDLELDWGIQEMPSGEYTLTIEAENKFQEWELSQSFIITNEMAKELNENSPFKIITPTWVKLVSVLFIIYAISVAFFIFMRRKVWEKKWKRLSIVKKKKKKRKAR